MPFVIFLLVLVIGFQVEADVSYGLKKQRSQSFYKRKRLRKSHSKFTQDSFFVGHSLTQTSYTLPKGRTMMGTFALGYGLTDNITLATSPWLLGIYNTPNLIVRAKQDLSKDMALGFQAGYFRSSELFLNIYEMELYYLNTTVSKRWNRNVTSHFSLNTMYFLNEENPFSIRVSNPESPLQISLSSLHEVSLPKQYGIGLEAGLLGTNHSLPYLHLGLSFFHKTKKRLIQFGFSFSATENFKINDLRYLGQGNIPSDEFKEFLTHPEVQFQYYF